MCRGAAGEATCPGIQQDMNINGHDLYPAPPPNTTPSASACCDQCAADPKCAGWMYLPKGDGNPPQYRRGNSSILIG